MKTASATVLSQIASILGTDNVSADSAKLAEYEVDGARPSVVARPGTAAEVAEVMRFAAAEKLAVIPCGARTKLGIGAPPQRYDIALDLARLNRVLAYDPGDLTLSVEAGLPLVQLSDTLAEHGQMLPLAVPFTSRTTVGGTIAAGVDSPLRQFYGTARDYVLGMEYVTGDGTAAKSGGRVVKNVAGYDLHKLLIGSLGTLGVITVVNFRTFPLPPASRGFLATFPSVEGALDLRAKITASHLQPLTLEILSPELARIFAERAPRFLPGDCPAPGPWFSTTEWTLAAGFGGNLPVLERYAHDLARMATETGAASSIVLGDDERPLVWGRLRECITLMLDSSPLATIVKISARAAQLGRLLPALQHTCEQHGFPFAAVTRGVGVIYLALLPWKNDAEEIRRLAETCAHLQDQGTILGDHVTIPWCPTELKRRVSVWGLPRGDLDLMLKVKDVFDPQHVLSPGRFYGGI
jgi:glycolate oxidase FAD binding subunit